jgi:hypothetical protein
VDDRPPRPDRVWNRIPDAARQRIITLALDQPALSPRSYRAKTKGKMERLFCYIREDFFLARTFRSMI